MGRVKRCVKCGEVLKCEKCGARQSPESPSWARVSLQLTEEQKRLLEILAKKEGVSVSEFVRRGLEDAKDSDED